MVPRGFTLGSGTCSRGLAVGYNGRMDAMCRQLLDAALTLPDGERAILAAELIDSLDPAVDADHEAAWGDEIAQRIAALDRGATQTIPWDEVRARIIGQ
jgi:putative addiction module component (TIGR02574 family)